jgi:flagellar capping protein FliD
VKTNGHDPLSHDLVRVQDHVEDVDLSLEDRVAQISDRLQQFDERFSNLETLMTKMMGSLSEIREFSRRA